MSTSTSVVSPPATPQGTRTHSNRSTVLADILERLPRNIKVVDEPGKLTVREAWFHWQHIVTLIVLGLLAYAMTILLPQIQRSEEPIPGVVINIGAMAGLVAFYWALAGIFNTTTISASEDTITRYIGPLPWWGEFKIRRSDVQQLFVTRKKRSRRRMTFWDWDGDDTTERSGEFSLRGYKQVSHYLLKITLNDERAYYSVSNEYGSPETPRILEYLIEARMKIVDQTVRGEIGRTTGR